MDLKVSQLAARLRGNRLGSAVSKQTAKPSSMTSAPNAPIINFSRIKLVAAENIDHDTAEGRKVFYEQLCYLLSKKCK